MAQTKTETNHKTNINYKGSENLSFWEKLKNALKRNLGLTAIINAALLLEITSGLAHYAQVDFGRDTMESLVDQEMEAIFYRIHDHLSKVEVTLNNMAWVVSDDLAKADSMFAIARSIVENNPTILGSSITFIPNYYPEKGYWFEPYAVRRTKATAERPSRPSSWGRNRTTIRKASSTPYPLPRTADTGQSLIWTQTGRRGW